MAKLTEVRWHGRGGQGAKTAGYVLAVAAAEMGWQVQAFPEYGAERRGAPMRSYVRISDGPIRLRSAIEHPDVVIVLDPSLIETENVLAGLPEGGVVIVNSPKSPQEVSDIIGGANYKVCTVDASGISVDTIGREMPNTPMLGALAKVHELLDLDTTLHAVEKQLSEKLPPAVVEGNKKAIQRAYEEVKVA